MTREEYIHKYWDYFRMSTQQLKQRVSELYTRKFELHDLTAYDEHRVAARVLVERERDGDGLVFHLKNIIPKKSC